MPSKRAVRAHGRCNTVLRYGPSNGDSSNGDSRGEPNEELRSSRGHDLGKTGYMGSMTLCHVYEFEDEADPDELGLERTDNNMDLTSWPQVSMVNQKNYYTEYLKRDEQLLALRLQNEAARNKMVQTARDKDRALANPADDGADGDVEMGDADRAADEDAEPSAETAAYSKVIIIHPGSQNLRIGLASDILPKTIPMVIARKAPKAECEMDDGGPRPKRRKVSEDDGEVFDEAFTSEYVSMTADLKGRAKKNGVRSVPNAREQAIIYNRKSRSEEISEHNDTVQINWTEIPSDPAVASNYITGNEAIRIPDNSTPRYKLSWPMRYGVFNEADYTTKALLLQDFGLIIEDAMLKQLKIPKSSWHLYSCVYVVPDLYDRTYVTTMLELLFTDFGFARVTFIQESISASFGAGYSTCVVVDIGAQKTSICCVEEGLCVESSRVLLRYGGEDVTEAFTKMMLMDCFPYAELDLRRRYDFILAEELKKNFCTFAVTTLTNVSKPHEFDLRVPDKTTRHFYFKTYDQVVLAPLGLVNPRIFDNAKKLLGRRRLISRSYDLYDGTPNDPTSAAQNSVLQMGSQDYGFGPSVASANAANGSLTATDAAPKPKALEKVKNAVSTPDQDGPGSPQPEREGSPEGGEKEQTTEKTHPVLEQIQAAELRDATLPVISLTEAINLSIAEGAKGDDRKLRDFYGGIMAVGGGTLIPHFHQFLEEELHVSQPKFKKELIVSLPPREIDPQVLVWKGASVFGKLQSTNDTWIGRLEYELLNSRVLTYKCLWGW